MRDTSKPLRAGDLSHKLTMVAPAGTAAVAETIVATGVPAQISALPPQFQQRENLSQSALQTQTAYQVSVRYRTDLEAYHVFREECCTQREFQVLAIVPSERHDALDLSCVTSG